MTKTRKFLTFILAAIVIIHGLFWICWVYPFWGMPFNASRHTQVPITPPWALECWVWEDDLNTAAAVRELLAGYAQYDIPARTILIDSPWSTRYNDFIVDEERYPEPAKFFGELEQQGYRVVLWMTPLVDSENKDTAIRDSRGWFEEARSKGYLAADGQEFSWWKGRGGFIDYTNPEAMGWWRGLQQQVFDWGIDGWKLDGAATLFSSRFRGIPIPWQKTHAGWMTTRQYMDHYYRDEYRHGLTQNPEFITLARSIDGDWIHPEGFAPFDASPVNWVGDQDKEWPLEKEGLEEALSYIMQSAKLGYNIIGSDIPGYGGSEIPPNLYIRWAQFSAFCGLFLNGGHGDHRLWLRSPDEFEIIRRFAWLHDELVPYIYSHTVRCHNGGKPLMRPVDSGKYQYFFGDDFFVSPVYQDSLTHTVTLPPGRWRHLLDDSAVLEGPQTLTRDYSLREYPVFIREGAIVPLNVSREYTGFGTRESAGATTWLIYPNGSASFTLVHPDQSGEITVAVNAGVTVQVAIGGVEKAHILRLHCEAAPTRVVGNGVELEAGTDWNYLPERKKLIVSTGAVSAAEYEISF